MLKRFPLKARLSVSFGLLFAVSMTIINVISIRTSRLALEQQAASHLITLAENQATIFEQTYIENLEHKWKPYHGNRSFHIKTSRYPQNRSFKG